MPLSRRTRNRLGFHVALVVITSVVAPATSFGQNREPAASPDHQRLFQTKIRATLVKHCVNCHGPKVQKGKLRLDTLPPEFDGAAAETWHDVLNRLDQGEMPPKSAPQPDTPDRRQLTKWIRNGLQAAAERREGGDRQVVIRRLTGYEYNNTVRDLLGMDLDYAKDLPPESASADGFKNNGATLAISPLQIEYYLKAARAAMDNAIVTGPAPEVHRHHFERSTGGNRRRNNGVVGNRMPPGGAFYAKLLEFPRQGEFVIRITAGSVVPQGMGVPRMRVAIGIRSDTQSPAKTVGEIDVANHESDKQVYEFRGRIEEFPLPGHNPKFPGVTVMVSNVYDDGLPTARPFVYKPIKLNKKQRQQISAVLKKNAPLQLPKTNPRPDAKTLKPFRTFVEKLQRQVEELRLIAVDHTNQLDIAYRLHDIRDAKANLQSEVEKLAKHFAMEPAILWSEFRELNEASLASHQTVFARFPKIKPISRNDKAKAQAYMPKQAERSTLVVDSVDFVGPVFKSWPPQTHQRLLPDHSDSERDRAVKALKAFAPRAYRRPARPDDIDGIMAFYDKIRSQSSSFEEAMRECFSLMLISPDFLYLVEPDADDAGRALNPFELASRLSYFLWSTMPDEALLDLAKSGRLTDAQALEEQVRTMIADPRSEQFVEHFTDQWLDLSGIDRVAINPEYYPQFDDQLKPLMRRETQLFFAEILRKDLSALNLIDADFTMLNEPLAKHYGLADRGADDGPDQLPVRGHAFRRVELKPADRRGGLLAHGSILMLNSTGEDSHPIRRAVWILDRLLNDPPAPPPPDVPALDSDTPDFAKLPLKRQLELHRQREACNDCHRGIDPWGIPLEHYDAVGKWRDEVLRVADNGKSRSKAPVDDQATLLSGSQVQGLEGLKDQLLNHQRERFAKALTSKLLGYGLGRSLTLEDRPQVEQLAKRFEEHDYRLADLVVAIVQSKTFQRK